MRKLKETYLIQEKDFNEYSVQHLALDEFKKAYNLSDIGLRALNPKVIVTQKDIWEDLYEVQIFTNI